jgi:hypothetical protein
MNREEMESTHQGNLSAARNYRQAQARLIDRLQITEQKSLHRMVHNKMEKKAQNNSA